VRVTQCYALLEPHDKSVTSIEGMLTEMCKAGGVGVPSGWSGCGKASTRVMQLADSTTLGGWMNKIRGGGGEDSFF